MEAAALTLLFGEHKRNFYEHVSSSGSSSQLLAANFQGLVVLFGA